MGEDRTEAMFLHKGDIIIMHDGMRRTIRSTRLRKQDETVLVKFLSKPDERFNWTDLVHRVDSVNLSVSGYSSRGR